MEFDNGSMSNVSKNKEFIIYHGVEVTKDWPQQIREAQFYPTVRINGKEYQRLRYGQEKTIGAQIDLAKIAPSSRASFMFLTATPSAVQFAADRCFYVDAMVGRRGHFYEAKP